MFPGNRGPLEAAKWCATSRATGKQRVKSHAHWSFSPRVLRSWQDLELHRTDLAFALLRPTYKQFVSKACKAVGRLVSYKVIAKWTFALREFLASQVDKQPPVPRGVR